MNKKGNNKDENSKKGYRALEHNRKKIYENKSWYFEKIKPTFSKIKRKHLNR
jgi:hypothetical protein